MLKKLKATDLFKWDMKCGKCLYFETDACRLGPSITSADAPCLDGVLLLTADKQLTLIRVFALNDVKYKTIRKSKLTTKRFKDDIGDDFMLTVDEVEELIVLINRKMAKPEKTIEAVTKTKAVDPEISAKAVALLKSPDIIGKFIDDSNRMVVKDEDIRKLVLFTFIGVLGDKPHNLAMIGPWSIGKTHITVSVSGYFDDVWSMGYMSPKALIHLKGEYDEDKDAYIIDLRFKTLLFLDRPNQETLEVLKPLLSRDKYEIEYKFVEKKTGETWTSILRGYPVCVLCAVDSRYTEEYTSRWITASPESSREKIKSVIWHKGDKIQFPDKFVSGEGFKVIKRAFEILRDGAPYRVIIPFGKSLAMNFRADKLVDQRFFDMFVSLVRSVAVLHSRQREKDESGRVIADIKDYEEARKIFMIFESATVYGVGLDVIDFYEKIIKTDEWYKVLSYDAIMLKYEEVYGHSLGRDRMMLSYIKPLERIGLIDLRPDPSDGRRKQVIPLKMKTLSLINDEGFKTSILRKVGV